MKLTSSKTSTWVAALFFSHIVLTVSYGQQYEVKGTVTGVAYEANGQPKRDPMELHDFTVEVSKCTWEMTLKITDESADGFRKVTANTGRTFVFPEYERFTFDGEDLYCFIDHEIAYAELSAKMRDEGRPIPPTNDNRANGIVVAQEVPHLTEDDGAIWLAYASGCYFKDRTDKRLEVTWLWGLPESLGMLRPEKSVKRTATWQLQPEPPHLPRSVTYYFGEVGGFTNAQFTVLSYMSAEGVTLPKESTLDVYRKDPAQLSDSNAILLVHYVLKTTEINRLEKRFVFPPPVPVLTTVADHRFNGPTDPSPDTSVSYSIQSRFLTKGEARNSTNYAQFKFNPSDPDYAYLARKKHEKIKWIVICLVAIVASIFAISAFRNIRVSQKTG